MWQKAENVFWFGILYAAEKIVTVDSVTVSGRSDWSVGHFGSDIGVQYLCISAFFHRLKRWEVDEKYQKKKNSVASAATAVVVSRSRDTVTLIILALLTAAGLWSWGTMINYFGFT